MSAGGFSGRTRELQEAFFKERDEQLLKALREQTALKEAKKALADASGILDEHLIDHLHALGVSDETLAAVALIPLITVAWADGNIDVKERRALIAAAEEQGLAQGHPAHQLLKRWLDRKPEPRLLEIWKSYVSALGERLGEADRNELKREILARARIVAESAGGLLGIGGRVSKAEQAALDDLEKSF